MDNDIQPAASAQSHSCPQTPAKALRRMHEPQAGSSDMISHPWQISKDGELRVPSTIAIPALQTEGQVGRALSLKESCCLVNDSFQSQEAKWKITLHARERLPGSQADDKHTLLLLASQL